MTERAGERVDQATQTDLSYRLELPLEGDLLSHLRIGAQALSEVGLTVKISDPLDYPQDGDLAGLSTRAEISAVNGDTLIALWSVYASVEHAFYVHLQDDRLVRERAMAEAAQRAAESIKMRMDNEAAKKAKQS